MQIRHPFIQLPIKFDAARLAAEVAAVEEHRWRLHPQRFRGNSMLPLLAVNGDPANESFAGEMRPTPELERCPYLWQTMASLGVTLGRTRLMRLAGHAEVTAHADQGYYWTDRVRVHIPIVTRPDVKFHCGDAVVHMAAGECWIFDTWRLHKVLNHNDDQRIHLVVDTVGGSKFWQMVEAGHAHPGPTNAAWKAAPIAYEPGAKPALALESANVPEVMTPWEVESLLGFLLGESTQSPQTQLIVRHISQFTRDWRALWARYGTKPQGRREYQQRLSSFLAAIEAPAGTVTLRNGLNLYSAIMAMVGTVAVSQEAIRADAAAMADRA